MKVGRGQLRILVILGFLLFGNLPRVIRETASSLRTRSSRMSDSVKGSESSKEAVPKEMEQGSVSKESEVKKEKSSKESI